MKSKYGEPIIFMTVTPLKLMIATFGPSYLCFFITANWEQMKQMDPFELQNHRRHWLIFRLVIVIQSVFASISSEKLQYLHVYAFESGFRLQS